MLLKMQKELRCKSAAQRRQALEEQKSEKLPSVSHREVMSGDFRNDSPPGMFFFFIYI